MIINSVTKWRESKGISKAHLARRVGVDRSYVTKLEQGRMQPSGEMMFRIAKYLGQPLEAVFQHIQGFGESAIFSTKTMPERQNQKISRSSSATFGTNQPAEIGS